MVEFPSHVAVIDKLDIQFVLFRHAVAQLVGARERSSLQIVMSESAVGRAHLSVANRKVRVKFDGALIEFERSLNVAGGVELAPSRGGLQSLGRPAERLFQRLIEARQRICGLSELGAKACGCDS